MSDDFFETVMKYLVVAIVFMFCVIMAIGCVDLAMDLFV